jgi:hypothetical protein
MTEPLPPPPQLVLQPPLNGPLQEVRNKTTSERVEKKEKALLRIIWHPTADLNCILPLDKGRDARSPLMNVTRMENNMRSNAADLFNS